MLTLETRVARNTDILHAAVGGDESVMLSIEAGQYYGLNAVGRAVWELLETPKTVAELRDSICADFEVDGSVCEADLLNFVEELREKDIVRVA